MRIWDPTTGQTVRTLKGHGTYVLEIVWSPDGHLLASASADRSVQVWEATTGQLLQRYAGHRDAVNAIVWSPDGRWLVSASADRSVQVWETATGNALLREKSYPRVRFLPLIKRAHEVAAQREDEARKAAKILGLAEVVFLRYPDGEVEDTHALRADLVVWIRRWQPDMLFTHDPEQPFPPYLCHRDHRMVGRATLDAVSPLARDHLAFAEQVHAGLAPHKVGEVWLIASNTAESYVDIIAGFERKVAARLVHVSQTPDPAALVVGWQARSASIGESVSLALAEAFTRLVLD